MHRVWYMFSYLIDTVAQRVLRGNAVGGVRVEVEVRSGGGCGVWTTASVDRFSYAYIQLF